MHLIATCVESWGVGCQVGARVEFTVDALQPVISDSFDSHFIPTCEYSGQVGLGLHTNMQDAQAQPHLSTVFAKSYIQASTEKLPASTLHEHGAQRHSARWMGIHSTRSTWSAQ